VQNHQESLLRLTKKKKVQEAKQKQSFASVAPKAKPTLIKRHATNVQNVQGHLLRELVLCPIPAGGMNF